MRLNGHGLNTSPTSRPELQLSAWCSKPRSSLWGLAYLPMIFLFFRKNRPPPPFEHIPRLFLPIAYKKPLHRTMCA